MAVNAGMWAYLVTNLVVAYGAGGAAAAGLLGVASFVAPTVVSPFAGIPAARWRPERLLAAVTVLRVVAVALTVGLVAFDGPIVLLVPLVLLESGARRDRPLASDRAPAAARHVRRRSSSRPTLPPARPKDWARSPGRP